MGFEIYRWLDQSSHLLHCGSQKPQLLSNNSGEVECVGTECCNGLSRVRNRLPGARGGDGQRLCSDTGLCSKNNESRGRDRVLFEIRTQFHEQSSYPVCRLNLLTANVRMPSFHRCRPSRASGPDIKIILVRSQALHRVRQQVGGLRFVLGDLRRNATKALYRLQGAVIARAWIGCTLPKETSVRAEAVGDL